MSTLSYHFAEFAIGAVVTVRRSRGIVRPGSEIGARSRPESRDSGRSLSLLIKDITASPNGYCARESPGEEDDMS